MLRPYCGCKARQVQDIDLHREFLFNHVLRDFDQPKAFRHLAGAGVFGTRRSVDQQDSGRLLFVVVATLGGLYGLMGGDPVGRQIILRIGKILSSFLGYRTFARILVAIPSHIHDSVQFGLHGTECRIDKLIAEAPLKFILGQLRAGHALARFGGLVRFWYRSHGVLPLRKRPMARFWPSRRSTIRVKQGFPCLLTQVFAFVHERLN